MPDQPDDDHVPPLKVMRKRLNGVYRADTGFSGTTRRYVLIVAMLVGLASVPTLAAITAGSNELADGRTDTMDIPVLPPLSPGPIQVPTSGTGPAPSASASTGPWVPPAQQGGSRGADAAKRLGVLLGETGERRPVQKPAGPVRRAKPPAGSTAHRRVEPPRRDEPPRRVEPPHRVEPSRRAIPRVPGLPSVPGESALIPGTPSDGKRQHRHTSPDRPGAPKPSILGLPEVPDEPVEVVPPADDDESPCEQDSSSPVKHRSPDRSEHRRRSPMADRPQNIRAAAILERGHANSSSHHGRRLIPEARTDENQIANHSYRGSHRGGGLHHADDHTPAQRRSSRMGRHHAEPSEDISGKWR